MLVFQNSESKGRKKEQHEGVPKLDSFPQHISSLYVCTTVKFFLSLEIFLFLSVCVMETGIMSPDVLKKALPFVADNKLYTRLKGSFENQFQLKSIQKYSGMENEYNREILL